MVHNVSIILFNQEHAFNTLVYNDIIVHYVFILTT